MKVKNENVCFIYNVNCNAISVRKKIKEIALMTLIYMRHACNFMLQNKNDKML